MGVGRRALDEIAVGREALVVLLSIQEGDRNAPDLPVDIRLVSPDYLALLRVSLVRGRYPTAADDEKAPDVVVVNRALARLLYPGEDPIGQLLPMGALGRIIVGVPGDIHHVAHPPPGGDRWRLRRHELRRRGANPGAGHPCGAG